MQQCKVARMHAPAKSPAANCFFKCHCHTNRSDERAGEVWVVKPRRRLAGRDRERLRVSGIILPPPPSLPHNACLSSCPSCPPVCSMCAHPQKCPQVRHTGLGHQLTLSRPLPVLKPFLPACSQTCYKNESAHMHIENRAQA